MKWRHVFTRYGIDLLVVLLAIGGEIEVATGHLHGRPGVVYPAVLGWTLPLLLRRRLPLLAPLAALAALVGESFAASVANDTATPLFALIVTTWVIAVENDRPLAFLGAAATFAAIVIVSWQFPGRLHASDVFFVTVFAGLAFVAGLAMRGWLRHAGRLAARAAELERSREAAVAEERARIARELHDVVAHSVSVMVVQAGAARRLLLPGQERERVALETVERTGREALSEMRRMLGVLPHDDEAASLAPQPGLDDLDKLLAELGDAGLPVRLRVEGDAQPLPPGLDCSAYRIVQEGLTNALRQASPARAEVVVRYAGDALELEVADDGGADEGRNGLAAMRERVAVYGGELEDGPLPDGRYRVRARLPVEAP